MTDGNDTPQGTDNVETPASDSLDDIMAFYNSQDGNTVEAGEDGIEQGGEDGEELEVNDPEVEAGDEAAKAEDDGEELEAEDDAESDSEPEPEIDPERVIRLSDGTETTFGDLTKGYMRQSDYTRKTQELGEHRKEIGERRQSVEADASQIQGITQAFVDHLSTLLPEEPDTGLIYSDPAKYQQQKAIYDHAASQVQKLVEVGSQAKEVTQKLSAEDRQRFLQEENRKLVEMFPEAGTQEGRSRIFNEATDAIRGVGFTDQEIAEMEAPDHRLIALAKWAKRGMDAEKARKTAREKVQKAPKSPKRKANTGAPNPQRDAMKRLAKSGSVDDAVSALIQR